MTCYPPGDLISTGGSCRFWGNTWESTSTTAPILGCSDRITQCLYQNNHIIGPEANLDNCDGSGTCQQNHNSFQLSIALANAVGYYLGSPSPYPWAPFLITGPTVGTGIDLSANCGALPWLCSDSTIGVNYDTVNHVVVVPARTAVARPATPDIGAYQFVPSTASGNRHRTGLLPWLMLLLIAVPVITGRLLAGRITASEKESVSMGQHR